MNNKNNLIVICGRFLTALSYYMIIPFLSVYLTKYKGLPITQVGILLSALAIGRRGFGIIIGYISESLGYKKTFILGLLLEALSFLGLIIFGNFYMLCIITFSIGIGGCLYNISAKALLSLNNKGKESTHFSMLYIALNVGALVGPLLCSLFISLGEINFLFILATISHFIFIIICIMYINDNGQIRKQLISSLSFSNICLIFKDKYFIYFNLIIIITWMIIDQIHITIPLYIVNHLHSDKLVGLLIAINPLFIVCFQLPLLKLLKKVELENGFLLIAIGLILMSCGWSILAIHASIAFVIFAISLFSVGEMFFISVFDSIVQKFATGKNVGLYFGVSLFSWTIGSCIASSLGTLAFEATSSFENNSPYWITISSIGIAIAVIIILFKHKFRIELRKKASITNNG